MSAATTDNALKSAFVPPAGSSGRKRGLTDGLMWFACSSHDINLLHEHVFDKDDPSLANIKTALKACKAVVEAYKRTEKVQFKKELQQHNLTRWDSR